MSFPVSPVNGQQANINGITYTYSTSLSAWSVSTSVSNTFVNINVSNNVNSANLLATGLASVTGNVTGGNLLTAGLISAVGSITTGGDHSLVGNIVDTGALWINTSSNGNITLNPNGTGQVNIPVVLSVTGNVTGGNILTSGVMSSTGNATYGNLTVSTGTVTLGNIVNANGNAVGNIGSSSAYFNTIFGKATTAQYADLAELYSADVKYAPGTVLVFGGDTEVTISTTDADPRVAGVVSTNPAHLMNSKMAAENTVALALQGRVPTLVTGNIRKGDMMVTAGNGHARASNTPAMGTVIGKALENFDGDSGTIEIVVGRV